IREGCSFSAAVSGRGKISIETVAAAARNPFAVHIIPNALAGEIAESWRITIRLPVITKLDDAGPKRGLLQSIQNERRARWTRTLRVDIAGCGAVRLVVESVVDNAQDGRVSRHTCGHTIGIARNSRGI